MQQYYRKHVVYHLLPLTITVLIRRFVLLGTLTTIADPWYFWKGSCTSKAHKPVTLSGNATFTKV